MTKSMRIALLLGVVTVVAGAGLAFAQMEGPPPPDGPMQGLAHGHGRLADRLTASFDKNRDGKVTHDEMNRAIYARFVAATHGAPGMTPDQFAAIHAAEARQHVGEMFRRIDWNGDGRLTLEDYAAPQRVRFMAMDKDGTGSVSCAPSGRTNYRSESRPQDGAGDRRGRAATNGYSSRGGFGLSRFCAENDLNRDGTVTRAEFDVAVGKRFALGAHGSGTMSADQYASDEQQRFNDTNARTFKRLDKDGDGKLTLAEFAASELKLFARLDKNKDGVIAADEMRPRFQSRWARSDRSRAGRRYD